MESKPNPTKHPEDTSDFSGSCWDIIRTGALSDNDNAGEASYRDFGCSKKGGPD